MKTLEAIRLSSSDSNCVIARRLVDSAELGKQGDRVMRCLCSEEGFLRAPLRCMCRQEELDVEKNWRSATPQP